MNTEISSQKKKNQLMHVVVYRVEDACNPFLVGGRWGESAFVLNLKLRCLAREDVYAECDKTAAAQAYFEAVGQHRARKLRELGAPPFIIAAETELDRIESALCSVSFLREPAYLLDNLAEAWLITVNVESVEDGPFGIHSNGKDLPHVN